MDERWASWIDAATNVAYALTALVLVAGSIPAVRVALVASWSRQLHAWRYGRWLERQTPAPRWTTLLERDDLPAERS